MAKVCDVCSKGAVVGRTIKRKGLAKKKGGIGQHVTSANKRKFRPNLQRVKAIINGITRYYNICTSCIKANKVTKAA